VVRMTDAQSQRRTFERVDALRLELDTFAQCIETGAPYPIPFGQMLDGVSATEAIVKSIAEERSIDI